MVLNSNFKLEGWKIFILMQEMLLLGRLKYCRPRIALAYYLFALDLQK